MRATARLLARSLARASSQLSRAPSRTIKYIRANQDLIALSTANGHNRRSTPHVRFDDIISLLPYPISPSPLRVSLASSASLFWFPTSKRFFLSYIAKSALQPDSLRSRAMQHPVGQFKCSSNSVRLAVWFFFYWKLVWIELFNRYIEKPKTRGSLFLQCKMILHLTEISWKKKCNTCDVARAFR